MSYEYYDDFAIYSDGEHPVSWLVEEHTAHSHRHGCVHNGAYALLLRDNKHMPCMPPLRDFILTFICHGDTGVTEAAVYVFFRYDPATLTGYFLKHLWNRKNAVTEFGLIQNNIPLLIDKYEKDLGFTADPAGADNRLRLEVKGNLIAFHHNDVNAGIFKDTARALNGAGKIAFDRPHARRPDRGTIWLKNVRVSSNDAIDRRAVWKPISILFPSDYNGMVSPYAFHLQASALPGCFELKARLTGGPAERRDKSFNDSEKARPRMNELMTGPYLRIESGSGRPIGKFYLHRGTVGLNANWDRQATALPPAQHECPVERTFMLPALPADANLIFGYDYYEAEERQILKGGPTEIIIDPKTGAVLHGGPSLENCNYHIDIRSGDQKLICALIPGDDLRCAEARAFAENNHYFYTSEPVVFQISAYYRKHRDNPGINKIKISARFLDVYARPVDDWRYLPIDAENNANADIMLRMGFKTYTTRLDWGNRPVGVYHAELRLQLADSTIASLVRAFEVMPVDPEAIPAPLASGLPELLCAEFFECQSPAAAFDPWVGRDVDEYHYVSHNVFDGAFARRNKTRRVLRLYRRRCMLWLFPWMPEGVNPELYKDLLAEADLIYSAGVMLRFDLWRRSTYACRKGGWSLSCDPRFFKCFLDFLRSPVFLKSNQSILSAEIVESRGSITEEEFSILINQHWKIWLEYFNRWYSDVYAPAEIKLMKNLAPKSQWGWFGPYPPYGSIYKSAYFARYMGRDLTLNWHKAWQGPLRFESYPYICDYPVQRDVFMLASMKMEAPEMRLYPEIYGLVACPTDGHVMKGSPPYGRIRTPGASLTQRFYEYAYAAVWHDGSAFRYWEDNGFQPTHWARDHFAALLAAWPTIREVRPLKPARTTAFVYSRAVCIRHPDFHERRNPTYNGRSAMPDDVFNTAEEVIALAYEQARLDGQSAGFVTELRHLSALNPEDVDTLVLPPLNGLPTESIGMIRRCHEKGMNLLAFEDVNGLEDVFGVLSTDSVAVNEIFMAPEYSSDKLWHELAEYQEHTAHALCRAHYQSNGCRIILNGRSSSGNTIPVLTLNQTQFGSTALFTIPPTVVRREDGAGVYTYGSASISHLINRTLALILRQLGSPIVETTSGKLIAFWDTQKALRIIVADAGAPESIAPVEAFVTIRIPGRAIEEIDSAHQFDLIKQDGAEAYLRLVLKRNECALITIHMHDNK